jgi:hypothetical protein
MQKRIRKICKNCKLYNAAEGVCGVTVLHEGEYLELKVRPHDHCWWERMSGELSLLDGEDTEIAIQQIRVMYDLDAERVKVEAPMDQPNPLA